jgi:hypothetical protein
MMQLRARRRMVFIAMRFCEYLVSLVGYTPLQAH